MPNQNENQQLAAATTAFEQWRSTRTYPKAKTPEALRQQAVALLSCHSPATVMKTLRQASLKISGSNLQRWSKQPQQADSEAAATFVALPVVDEPVCADAGGLNLELSFNNGCHMRVQGAISPAQLTALAQSAALQAGVAS